jgi:hypothetical protein
MGYLFIYLYICLLYKFHMNLFRHLFYFRLAVALLKEMGKKRDGVKDEEKKRQPGEGRKIRKEKRKKLREEKKIEKVDNNNNNNTNNSELKTPIRPISDSSNSGGGEASSTNTPPQTQEVVVGPQSSASGSSFTSPSPASSSSSSSSSMHPGDKNLVGFSPARVSQYLRLSREFDEKNKESTIKSPPPSSSSSSSSSFTTSSSSSSSSLSTLPHHSPLSTRGPSLGGDALLPVPVYSSSFLSLPPSLSLNSATPIFKLGVRNGCCKVINVCVFLNVVIPVFKLGVFVMINK